MQNLKTWLLSIVLITPTVTAAPVTELPSSSTIIDEPTESPVTTSTQTLTTFNRAETGRALNLGQLESIQAETVLYEAQLARAKALNELQKNGYDRSFDLPFNPVPPVQDSNQADIKGAAQDTALPQVIEITGRGKDFTALLTLSSGNQVTIRTGSRIPGTDYVVQRISINEVIITAPNRSLTSLSFAG
ncbi:type IV pilus biogenesis protein PilP [Photorhabdus luminescens]|uniref:type IV pilus biogenesis protein PilP n=1 Tax=Photorhabdus luminescens TaxID=29488 RepID=UPI00223FEC2F|nr:type IV pilus biogenesis protein PilP [Photorhabdus luminescens]MCW7763429.1 type IV pilus biogenesis protein PilP [Photorhabdus luminescens subsp. venezuelensis]